MSSTDRSPQPRPRWIIVFGAVGITGMLILGLGEGLARVAGSTPWSPPRIRVDVRPGGRLYDPHPTLGYVQRPGAYEVELPTGYVFRMTHDAQGLRITHPPDVEPTGSDGEIWIFGGSFTHGWSVNDAESFPWIVQERLPAFRVTNFGVDGYGTLHSLIQLREALRTRRPARAAVLAYASFHDDRNTLSRSVLKRFVTHEQLADLSYPYARLDPHGAIIEQRAPLRFREVPGMRWLALAHLIEQSYDTWERRTLESHRVTEFLIETFVATARGGGVEPFLVGLTRDHRTNQLLGLQRRAGTPAADISVDLRDRRNLNLPHDAHPGPRAHRAYGRKVAFFLREGL